MFTYETVRRWALKFGTIIARKLERGRPRPDGRWHLDEVFVSVIRQTVVRLACGGQRRRGFRYPGSTSTARPSGGFQAHAETSEENKASLQPPSSPTSSDPTVLRCANLVLRGVTTPVGEDNRAENSHQPLRQRERRMKRFESSGSAQRFLSIHAAVYNVFNIQRHLTSRRTMRVFRDQAMLTWRQATNIAA